MFLIYQPEGSDEPTVFPYDPKKLMSAEREALERRTGMNYEAFTQAVVSGNSLARRSLLHMFLKRTAKAIRFEDVDFAWDELNLEFSREELGEIKAKLPDLHSGDDLAQALEQVDSMIETARDDEGKAPAKNEG